MEGAKREKENVSEKTIGEGLTERSPLISKNTMEMKYQRIYFSHEDQEVVVSIRL